MKNFPFFATQYGVAALTLREIPYQGKAYIKLLDTQQPELLLKECVDFCRVVGAEEIFASGDPTLEAFPFHTALWQMRCVAESIRSTDAALWPVQPETVQHFRSIYNEKIQRLPNSVWMDDTEEKDMLKTGDGYPLKAAAVLQSFGYPQTCCVSSPTLSLHRRRHRKPHRRRCGRGCRCAR